MWMWRTLLPSLGSAPRAWEQTHPLPQREEPAALYCLFIQSRLKQKIVTSTEPRKAAERQVLQDTIYRLFLTPTSKPHLWLLLRRTTFKLTVYNRFWLCLLNKVNKETVKWDLLHLENYYLRVPEDYSEVEHRPPPAHWTVGLLCKDHCTHPPSPPRGRNCVFLFCVPSVWHREDAQSMCGDWHWTWKRSCISWPKISGNTTGLP